MIIRWGGENYQEESSIDMYLSNISIADVVLSLRGKTRYIGLKSPMNFRLSAFEKRIKARKIFSREFTISKNKDTYWLFTLYEFESDSSTLDSSISSVDGGILHMLSPSFDSAMISQIKTSQKTAIQAPTYRESDFISSHILQTCSGFDTLVDLTASIGIQDINFLSCSFFKSHIYLSPKPIELEHNIRVLLPRLSTQPQVHFLHTMETVLLKDRIHENRRMLNGTNCCVYVDLFNELSVEQIKNLDSNKKLIVNKLPLEKVVQQCIEYCVNLDSIRKVILRVPKELESVIGSALGCFEMAVFSYEEKDSLSSCCTARQSCVMIVEPSYPSTNRLAPIWNTLPQGTLRKQLNSVFSTVLADRSDVVSILTQAIAQKPARSDQEIWDLARKAYFSSFHLPPTATIDKTMAIKVDRSIVRVYGNKMKYVDMVVPVGCRPHQILCLGGVDAHLAHDLAKMYGCTQKEQVIVFGEGDRRKEENRTDYCFIPYPKKESLTWTEYREQLLIKLHESLSNVTEIDMVIVCCPHAVPFFGSILSYIIDKLSPDAVLVMNDHSVTTKSEEVLLDLVHDFHRKVTSSHINELLDRDQLSQAQELDEDDKCFYSSGNSWEDRLKQYGLTRYVSEKNKQLWNANDPNNILK